MNISDNEKVISKEFFHSPLKEEIMQNQSLYTKKILHRQFFL